SHGRAARGRENRGGSLRKPAPSLGTSQRRRVVAKKKKPRVTSRASQRDATKNDGRERGGFKSSRHGKRPSAAGPKGEQKRAAEERERAGERHVAADRSRFLRGESISPAGITGRESVADLIDTAFLAYNAA